MSGEDSQDLLSAALDDAGLSEFLDFGGNDIQEESTPHNQVQYIQSALVQNDVKVPITQVISLPVKPNQNTFQIKGGTQLPRIIRINPNGTIQRTSFIASGTSLLRAPSTQLTVRPSMVSVMKNGATFTVRPSVSGNIQISQPQYTTVQRLQPPEKAIIAPPAAPPDEDVMDEEDDVYQADTYADYMPSKLKVGNHHPDQVVETSSLSSVLPPDVWYRFSIPEETIDESKLSALQLEAIVYACQQHETFLPDGTRAGFLLGDGAGVGKGRTLAGIILENYLLDRKRAIWLSVSNDLRYDAERDLRDIGAKKLVVYPLNKFKYGKISSKENGGVKKGVIFATYSSLIGESHTSNNKYRTRLKQLLHWCGDDFDGVIVFDECHKAKNLCPVGSTKPTKTGMTVLELQRRLPKARIVYASATGASEPKNMAYMVRLGLWGAGTSFPEFTDFVNTVEKRGVGAMELVAIDMKLRGVYIARQLSFHGVQFRIEDIPLSKKFVNIYNECVQLWVDAKTRFDKALELMEDDGHIKKTVWGQFWASHQRFFKYLCIASKVKHAVQLSREALKSDKCVVIGLQSTGEAKTLEQLEENGGELSDFVSTAKAVFQTLIEKHFPAPNRKKTLRLLGRDTTLLDELGISVNKNGTTRLTPLNSIMKNENSVKREKLAKVPTKSVPGAWNISDSSDDSGSEKASDFQPSGSDESEDFESVSEGSDIDQMWNEFENKMQTKAKKRRISKKKKTTKGQPRKKKLRMIDKSDELKHIKAEFMSEEAGEICEKMRDELIERIEETGGKLPPNTLDELIDELGGADNVAEMTGRKGRVISNESGTVQYESRTENDVALEILNVTEKQRFMDGDKTIAIISEAASSGISLHSDRRALNRKRRVHLTIELPWSADRAIQQFGRTHRSNQTSAPEYVFLISDLAGEQRFASIVAKRLESLGALTHGDRRATESRDLSKYNIDNKYGRTALEIVMKSIVGQEQPVVPPPEGFEDFFKACRIGLLGVGLAAREGNYFSLEKDYNVMAKFLNRILGMEVDLQNALFKYFSNTLETVIKNAKRLGRYDLGIIDLTSDVGKVDRRSCRTFFLKHSTGAAKVELHEVAVERGMAWEEAESLWKHCKLPEEGYYVTNSENAKKTGVFLAVSDNSSKTFSKQVFRIYKPNTGMQSKSETMSSLKEKAKKVLPDEAEKHWKQIYEDAEKRCSHEIWLGRCSRKTANLLCDIGLRKRLYHILSGSVLSLWENFEKTLPSHMQSKLQIVRLKTKDGLRVIGTLVPEKALPSLIAHLEQSVNPVPKPVINT
ncbi:Protein strawberry notch -like protein 1 [Halotydeus destructor]|nr:Protein strawberry notch -like protein 1 [Halotydeus destructor]